MNTTTVSTSLGSYRGIAEHGVCVFRGIPYARPPLGSQRFRQAEPAPVFTYVHDCQEFSPSAMQSRRQSLPMSEDCLYLNVWTPAENPDLLPVLVFLHGGSLMRGSGADEAFHSQELSRSGPAVIITLNFRLGVWGFLDFSFLDESCQSNVGLRDVLTALEWIHQHIQAFGGDPQRVTLMGQSSGGTMALTLAALPIARKYLARVISMSGNPILVQPRAHYRSLSRQFLDFTGIRSPSQLRSLSANELLSFQRKFPAVTRKGAGTFMLVLDDDMIPRLPIPAARSHLPTGLPMLLGTTREELSFTLIRPLARLLEVDHLVDTGANREDDALRARIRRAYRRYGRRHQAVLRSEIVFRMPNVWLAEALAAHNPVWQYRFDYSTWLQQLLRLYAFHSSDVPFVFGRFTTGFGRLLSLLIREKETISSLSRTMQRDILTFAAAGRLEWEPVCKDHFPARCYDRTLTVENAVDADLLDLFRQTRYFQRSVSGDDPYPF